LQYYGKSGNDFITVFKREASFLHSFFETSVSVSGNLSENQKFKPADLVIVLSAGGNFGGKFIEICPGIFGFEIRDTGFPGMRCSRKRENSGIPGYPGMNYRCL
jgi:hypothetical protein